MISLRVYLETTVNLTLPIFSFTILAWGFQLGWGAEKINEPLTHGSKGPTLFPEMQEPFDLHQPIIINKLIFLPQNDWWTQSVALA